MAVGEADVGVVGRDVDAEPGLVSEAGGPRIVEHDLAVLDVVGVAEEGVLLVLGQNVGRVRITVVDPGEEVLGVLGFLEQRRGELVDALGVDPAAVFLGHVRLIGGEIPGLLVGVEARVPAEALAEHPVRDHRDGGEALLVEEFGQGEIGLGDAQGGLVGEPGRLRIAAGEDRREGRPGLRPLGDGALEDDARFGEAVEIRAGVAGIAVDAEMVGAQGVDGDQQNVARLAGSGVALRVAAVGAGA